MARFSLPDDASSIMDTSVFGVAVYEGSRDDDWAGVIVRIGAAINVDATDPAAQERLVGDINHACAPILALLIASHSQRPTIVKATIARGRFNYPIM